jgi:acyl-homoserine lactone acylase PvdQ
MREEVVRSRSTGEHWLVERKENGVILQNFKGQKISLDWSTFNSWYEYPFYGSSEED